jgi:alkylated DNA repair dioxygenase AlkB
MSPVHQPSLLDSGSSVEVPVIGDAAERTILTDGAWIEHLPEWIKGSDQLFQRLLHAVPWRAERRRMFDRELDVPRLVAFYEDGQPLPDPALARIGDGLSAYYRPVLGEPFRTVGLCLYRDGSDSVAWHGDRIGRSRTEDTLVAIVSLGAPRPFRLRPKGGGRSRKFELGRGDLLVMGGSCQRTWEHSVPKVSSVDGPRISLQIRPLGVR